MASETTAWDIFNALGNLCKAARDNLWAEAWCTAMAPAKTTSRIDPPSKRKFPKACHWEATVAHHGILLVAGEGTSWRKFAETWSKFAGEMVNDGMETLAQTSWCYSRNGVAQKDKRFNYGKFLHQEQKNAESFQGLRSKDTQQLWKGRVINGW